MKHLEVRFVGSYVSVETCPPVKRPEYAFIGRSNVGKSSLINMLSQRKNIARVSNTPGKTQLINLFDVNETWQLVDLPGYGFAKVSKKQRAKFENMIENYLRSRVSLQCTFVLIDIRHPLQQIDKEFIDWLGEQRIAFVIVFTKTDKLKEAEITQQIELINTELLKTWEELPQQFITSSKTTLGREDILNFISEINKIHGSSMSA